MVQILLLAAFISLMISWFSKGSHGSEDELPIWIEPLVIILILIGNGFIGLY